MDAIVSARLPQEIKLQAAEIFAHNGTTPSKAINELFAYVVATGKLPDLSCGRAPAAAGPALALTPEVLQGLSAIKESTALEVDWGSDASKPYRQLIEEGRTAGYEAIS
jgi:hypothetical protein